MKPFSYVQKFLEDTKSVTHLDELNTIFENVIKDIGFNDWAYQLNNRSTLKESKPIIVASYDDEWVEHYIDNDYSSIDPIITKGPDELMPFQWNELLQKENLSSKQSLLFSEAEDYGIGEGLGVPIHGVNNNFAMISMVSTVSKSETSKIFKEYQNQIHTISLIYHSLAKDLIDTGLITSNEYSLTNREKRVFIMGCTRQNVLGNISNIKNIRKNCDFSCRKCEA